jgi:hypothetical protein
LRGIIQGELCRQKAAGTGLPFGTVQNAKMAGFWQFPMEALIYSIENKSVLL